MSRPRAVQMAVIALTLVVMNATARAETTRFRGEVSRGDTVLHNFESRGQFFEFRLLPTLEGWLIWIGDPVDRDRNFVAAATPTARNGVNPAVIEGWHFRNSDNTGANEPGPKRVDAPGNRREFAFVLNGDDFTRSREALETMLRRHELPAREVQAARDVLARIPKATGVLQVEAMEFSNLVEGGRAVIERMAFSVTIEWPQGAG